MSRKIRVWWQAFRYHFVPASIFPAVVGSAVSWAVDHTFSASLFLLVIVALVTNHIALNLTDDYFDFKHSVDSLKPGEKNPFTGGSGTLSSNLIRPEAMFKMLTSCYAVTVIIGLYLTMTRGLPVLLLGLLGVFCSVFYTAPPVKFSHHGLGELALLVSFGPVIGLGAYFVQSQTLTLEAFLATLPMGIMLFSMIVLNEIPDFEEDKRAGKLTLVARCGREFGLRVYILSWICTYSVIIGGTFFKIMPWTAVIALASLPLVGRSIITMRKFGDDPIHLAPANLDMIRAHAVTGIALVAVYTMQGLFSEASLIGLAAIWTVFGFFYIPAAVRLIIPKKTI